MERKLLGTRPPSSSLSGVVLSREPSLSSALGRAESFGFSQERALHISNQVPYHLETDLVHHQLSTTIPTRLDANSGKKIRFLSLTVSSREKGFRRHHPPIRLLAPPPYFLYPFIQERVLPPVPEVDDDHQGREEEQEDEQEGY